MKILWMACALALASACGKSERQTIRIDGSSTVFPISQAIAEAYGAEHPAHFAIGVSGTGGGFQKFCRGEIAISGASRPIAASERVACEERGVEFLELPVAYDGIAVVVHKSNDWVDHFTVAELARVWSPRGARRGLGKWSQIRAGWPDREFHLFGPGVDSGTYDYFTKAIVGEEHTSRGDFTASENDHVLVQGIASDRAALGFFGYAYYRQNASQLRLIPIDDGRADNGAGAIGPSFETIEDATYQPLTRPLFIYVSRSAAERADVARFLEFYLQASDALISDIGYVPLPDEARALVTERFSRRITGSVFKGGSEVGVTIETMLAGKS